MKLIKGTDLTPAQKNEVKAAFIYRYTVDNPHTCKTHWRDTGATQTDAQWLAEHAFYIKNDGHLADRHEHATPHYLAEA